MMPTVAMGPPSPGSQLHIAVLLKPSRHMTRAPSRATAMATIEIIPAGRPLRRSGRTQGQEHEGRERQPEHGERQPDQDSHG